MRATYNAAFSDGSGPRRIGAVTPVDVERFKAWLRGGDTMKRLKTANRYRGRTPIKPVLVGKGSCLAQVCT